MSSSKKALCVGINNFKNLPSAVLKGCVNDVKNMENILINYFGFTTNDIVKIVDDQATKVNIMSNLKAMVDGAREGKYDYLVFSLSTHGTQVPDLSGDEPDRADEAFCPHDLIQSGNIWDPNYIINDDEFHDLFVTLPPEITLEVFLDTCHSGTGLKAIDLLLTRKPRYLPPPSLEAFEKVEGCRSRGFYRSLLEDGVSHHILWAACRPDQTSADAEIEGDWYGAFTYYFCKVMHKTKNKLPRKEVLERVRAYLQAERYPQIPQLECQATDRSTFVK